VSRRGERADVAHDRGRNATAGDTLRDAVTQLLYTFLHEPEVESAKH